jgi:TPR repeat protein
MLPFRFLLPNCHRAVTPHMMASTRSTCSPSSIPSPLMSDDGNGSIPSSLEVSRSRDTFHQLTLAAGRGSAVALQSINHLAQEGHADALRWLSSVATRGCVSPRAASPWLGLDDEVSSDKYPMDVLYEIGEFFLHEDAKQAVPWFFKAAKKGHVAAQWRLGCCYEKGEGITRDASQSFSWLSKAADQGHQDALDCLLFSISRGIGCGSNDKRSFQWLSNVAERGNTQVQLLLEWMHKHGKGVQPVKKEVGDRHVRLIGC